MQYNGGDLYDIAAESATDFDWTLIAKFGR